MAEHNFKVGDRVVVVESGYRGAGLLPGNCGTVNAIVSSRTVKVRMDNWRLPHGDNGWAFGVHQLEPELTATERAEVAEARAKKAESDLKEQIGLTYRVRNLLWNGRMNSAPGVTTTQDLNAIEDVVRVLVDEVQFHDGLRANNVKLRDENASLRPRATAAEWEVQVAWSEVDRLKQVLAGERERGYKAALADVKTATAQITAGVAKVKEQRA